MDSKLFLIALVFLVSCREQESSCTDSLANNFDSIAVTNDGSCTYNAISVSPKQSFELSEVVSKTQGLICWDGLIWSQNDKVETSLFGIDPETASVSKEYMLENVLNTDFDCEAFIVSEDSIYLFTKQWVSAQTSVYVLPKVPGSYVARKKMTYKVDGLVTGATYIESKGLLVLCGYSSLVQPIFYLLYDFEVCDFFSGNKRKVSISLPFHQIEGITTRDGYTYYVTNENLSYQGIEMPQKLHIVDLSDLIPH